MSHPDTVAGLHPQVSGMALAAPGRMRLTFDRGTREIDVIADVCRPALGPPSGFRR